MVPLSRNQIQALWPVVYALHPVPSVGECVLLDACDTIGSLTDSENQCGGMREKRDSQSFTKIALTRRQFPQVAAYLASEKWECDQESAVPTMEPIYHPTTEDRLVRYIKTLAWWATQRRVPYAATAIGCSLYTYTPHEIEKLVVWAADNIRRTHKNTLQRLQNRFPDLPFAPTRPHRQVALRAPTPDEQALVAQALACFAPWTKHLAYAPAMPLWNFLVLQRGFTPAG